jgi:hypothetical protein
MSGKWVYTDSNGRKVFYVLRFDLPDGGKTIRPVHNNGQGWGQSDPPVEKLPLYNLTEIIKSPVVWVTEGEKCSYTAATLGLVSTTSAHGAKSASKSDWSPLRGKTVILLPDNDDAGRMYARDVARILCSQEPEMKIKIVELPGLERGEDIDDYIQKRDAVETEDIRREIERLVDAVPFLKPEDLISENDRSGSVQVSDLKYQPFPIECLPMVLSSFVREGSEALGCDPSYIAMPLLSALAAAIGNTRRIVLKRDWDEPAILWTGIVGDSGSMKTPALNLALMFIRECQARRLQEYSHALANYESDLADYEEARKRKGVSMPPRPKEPLAIRYVCSDTTIEALAVVLSTNPRGILLERDELSGWLGSFDQYKQGKGSDTGHWLTMHNAGSLTVDRKGGEHKMLYVPRASVGITGGIQPEILKRCFQGQYTENGLAARFILTMPPQRKKVWSEREISAETQNLVEMIFEKLFSLELDLKGDEQVPKIVHQSREAKALWIAFYNQHNEVLATIQNSALRGAFAKLEAMTARLALILHLVRWASAEGVNPDLVDETSIRMAIELIHWYVGETRRIYTLLEIGLEPNIEEKESDSISLANLVRKAGGTITVRDLMRKRQSLRTRQQAQAALDQLEGEGIGKWKYLPSKKKGGKPVQVFELMRTPKAV